ncbi:MAG: anaerobic ribonucleoside-triphosphate reductase [Longibaculum sp.]
MKKINNIDVEIYNGEMQDDEILAYINHVKKRYPYETLTSLSLTIDGDYVDMKYHLIPQPMERIRRITGYLVGTLDRFNDAKRAEEKDRVKHHI